MELSFNAKGRRYPHLTLLEASSFKSTNAGCRAIFLYTQFAVPEAICTILVQPRSQGLSSWGTRSNGSLLRRGSKGSSKGFFSGGVDPLSNESAGTELQATAESAGASARYHTQDGCHPGETIFCALLPGVASTPCVTVKMAGKTLRFSDV